MFIIHKFQFTMSFIFGEKIDEAWLLGVQIFRKQPVEETEVDIFKIGILIGVTSFPKKMCNNPLARLTTFLSRVGLATNSVFRHLFSPLILSLFVTEVLLLASRFSRASKHHPSHDGHITARKKRTALLLASSSNPTRFQATSIIIILCVCTFCAMTVCFYVDVSTKKSLCSQIDMKRYESVFF